MIDKYNAQRTKKRIELPNPAIATQANPNPIHETVSKAVSEWFSQKIDGIRRNPSQSDPTASRTRWRKRSSGSNPCDPMSGINCWAAIRKATA
jgi:hypothetical protein